MLFHFFYTFSGSEIYLDPFNCRFRIRLRAAFAFNIRPGQNAKGEPRRQNTGQYYDKYPFEYYCDDHSDNSRNYHRQQISPAQKKSANPAADRAYYGNQRASKSKSSQ